MIRVWLLERTPRVRVQSREDWQIRLLRAALRLGWGLRLELVVAAAVGTGWLLLAALLPRPLAGVVLVGLLAVVLVSSVMRGWLTGRLRAARVRRRWDRACRHARLVTVNDRTPAVVRVRGVLAGELLRVRMPAGLAVGDLEARAETVAATLGVRDVRVVRDRSNARYAAVTLVRRDPLEGTVPLPWPLLTPEGDAERESVA